MKTEDMRKMDFGRLRAGQRDAAKREVQVALLLERIADKEGITVTDEDVEKEIQIMAAQSQQPADALRSRLEKDGSIDRMRNRIRTDKAMDLVYQRATA
jgi:trigger factor